MSSFNSPKNSGFTLVEMVMVIVLVALMATLTATYFGTETDNQKYEATRTKVETLRRAILGDDTSDNEGRRKNFGYHGDMGKLPTSLNDLVTQGAQPAWTYHTFYGFGVGWRGPYVDKGFSVGTALINDEWGKTFVYTPASNPPILTSLGADNKAGGTGYNADIRTQFSFTQRFATVKGVAAMNDFRLTNQSVQIRYPSAITTLTYDTRLSDANGYFTFSSVPHGVRSIGIVGPSPGMNPIPVTVDTSDYQVPTSLINLGPTITYVPGTANSTGAGENFAQVSLRSGHLQTLQLEALTVSWANAGSPGFLYSLMLNGDVESFTPVASGVRKVFTRPLSVPSQSTSFNAELRLCLNADGSGTFDLDNYVFTLVFEWKGIKKKDTISFTVN